MDKLPVIGQMYDCYDDGKIRESRRYKVKITKIIPYKDADETTVSRWMKAVDEGPWLFATCTDYFVFAESYEQKDTITESLFVRTLDGRWFSTGCYFDSGLLIVD